MSINLSDKLSFIDKDFMFPQDIVSEYSFTIANQTHGHVLLGVEPYNNQLFDDKTGYAATISALINSVNSGDVQRKLGDITDSHNRFEVYLCSKTLDKYKYRLMFFEYRIGGYPSIVYIAQDIVNSIEDKSISDTTIVIKNEKEMRFLLDKVLMSKFVIELIQEVLNASIRKTIKNANSVLNELSFQDNKEKESEENKD